MINMHKASPALALLFMTLWWVLPVFALHLWRYPFIAYIASHTLYGVIIGIAVLASIGAAILNSSVPHWKDASSWEKYFWLCTAYTVQMAITLIT